MKQLLLAVTCCIALTAQQTKDKEKKIEHCGLDSSHDCHCIRHSHAVQDAYLEACRLNSKTDKDLEECMSKVPPHCSIVDRYDGDETEDQESAMSERCAMMCKKHDCLCDDGPRCHIGHDASEHEQNNNKTTK